MRVSAEQILPTANPTGGRAGRPAAGNPADTEGFGRILQHAATDRQTGKTPHAEKGPAKAAEAQAEPATDDKPRRMHWPDFGAKLAPEAIDTDGEPAEPEGDADTDEPGKKQEASNSQPQMQAAVQQATTQWPTATHTHNRRPAPGMIGHAAPGIGQPDADPASTAAQASHAATAARADRLSGSGQADGPPMPGRTQPLQAGPILAPSANEPANAAPGAKPETGAQPSAGKYAARLPDAANAPVTVTGAQSFPAPASYPAGPTMTALAGTIAADSGAKPLLSASAGLIQQPAPVAVASHMLKIELHPAELGMVTANLRLAGGQLSIELKPENQEAHRRLSSDTDTLVKSLQGLGFNVEKVTVLQPSVAVSAVPRTDAPAMANPNGRDSSPFQPGGSGGNGGSSGGQQSGRNGGDDGRNGRPGGALAREHAGGGLFI